MAVNRMDRIDSEMKKTLSNILSYELKNPIFENKIISVTNVSTTPDLRYSKVYLSIFPSSEQNAVFNEIRNSIPYIRKSIARKLNLRICPELSFKIDDSLEYSRKMDELFSKIETKNSEGENDL